jgi:hypothetical protein
MCVGDLMAAVEAVSNTGWLSTCCQRRTCKKLVLFGWLCISHILWEVCVCPCSLSVFVCVCVPGEGGHVWEDDWHRWVAYMHRRNKTHL